jgi:hypothetical protein
MMAISGGIFSTFKVDTGSPLIIGIQVLSGLGTACVIQMVSPNTVSCLVLSLIVSAHHCSDDHSSSRRLPYR